MSPAFYFCIIGYKPIGSILGIIDSAGQLMVKYKYTAYGKVTITKDTDGLADVNPFKYKGYYFDLESGMYYCHTRYYVPEWGRWLNTASPLYTDTYEFDKLNFFTYCGNSPVLRVDIEGQDSGSSEYYLGILGAVKWSQKEK